jgi:cyclophilin family peptidyl-prolyl cis-trans isomerase
MRSTNYASRCSLLCVCLCACRGLVACANQNEPHTNGAQFFITLDKTDWLDRKNTIFGKVVGDTIYNLARFNEVDVSSAVCWRVHTTSHLAAMPPIHPPVHHNVTRVICMLAYTSTAAMRQGMVLLLLAVPMLGVGQHCLPAATCAATCSSCKPVLPLAMSFTARPPADGSGH